MGSEVFELKPCPSCGGAPFISSSRHRSEPLTYSVSCPNWNEGSCPNNISTYSPIDTKQWAADAWNELVGYIEIAHQIGRASMKAEAIKACDDLRNQPDTPHMIAKHAMKQCTEAVERIEP